MFPPTSEERYFEERRLERNPDFAPPTTLYSQHSNTKTSQRNVNTKTKSVKLINEHSKGIIGNESTRKVSKEDTINSDSTSVMDIPLPPISQSEMPEVNELNKPENYEVPYFDLSVPPPNMTQFSIIGQSEVSGNVEFTGLTPTTGYEFPVQSHDQTLPYMSSMPPLNWQDTQNSILSSQNFQQSNWDNSNEQQSCVQTQQSLPIYGAPSTDAQFAGYLNLQSYSGAITNPTVSEPTQPKPKVNIIDPRFIQNKDVLVQNPGNMTMKIEESSISRTECENSNILTGNESSALDTNTSGSYSGKPVIYK